MRQKILLQQDRPQQSYRNSHMQDKRSCYFQVHGRYVNNRQILSHYNCGSISATDSRIFRYVSERSLCENVIIGYIKEHISCDNFVIVSRDTVALKRVVTLVEDMCVFFVLVDKEHASANEISKILLVGKLKETQYVNLLKI